MSIFVTPARLSAQKCEREAALQKGSMPPNVFGLTAGCTFCHKRVLVQWVAYGFHVSALPRTKPRNQVPHVALAQASLGQSHTPDLEGGLERCRTRRINCLNGSGAQELFLLGGLPIKVFTPQKAFRVYRFVPVFGQRCKRKGIAAGCWLKHKWFTALAYS